MLLHPWTLFLSSFETLLAIATLVLMVRAKAIAQYWPLLALVLSGIVPYFLLLWLRTYRLLSPKVAYELYFYTFWSLYLIAAVCSAIMTYTVFHEAFRPLKGLQTLGTIMYRWIASLSIAVAFGAISLPYSGLNEGITLVVSQFLRASGIIVLGLILFVGFSIKPLGLSFRSRVFGIGSGIAVIALLNTLQAGYFPKRGGMYSSLGLIETIFQCFAELIWIYYLWAPEPQRKFVLLPTTSPFHAWNQISEILGHDPGYVAIGGVPPEAFAAAELDIFNRASRNMAAADDAAVVRSFAPLRKTSALQTPADKEQGKLDAAEATARLTKAFQTED